MPQIVHAGLDVGSHTTRVVVGKAPSKRAPFSIAGVGSAPSRGVRNGYIINIDEASGAIREALDEAEKNSGLRIRKVTVGVGGVTLESAVATGSVMISRVDSEVADPDLARATEAAERNLDLTNKKIIHRVPLSYRLDGKPVLGRPHGMRGVKLEVKILYVTSFSQHVDDLISAVEDAGVDVEDVVAAPLAASVATLSRAQQTAGCVLANIGAETVSIAVFEEEQLLSLHVFQIGSTNITNDIALGLKIPLEEAEDMKRSAYTSAFGGFETNRKQLEAIIEARLRDIFDLIESHLTKIGKSGILPAGVILTGGGLLEIATTEDLARASLKLPARVVIPRFLAQKNNGGGKDGNASKQLDPAWAVAAGVCALGFNPGYASELQEGRSASADYYARRVLDWVRRFLP